MKRVELPDGNIAEFPAEMPDAEIESVLRRQFSPPKKPDMLDLLKQDLINIGTGAVRGAGSIGATILSPVDAAARALGIENDFIGRTDRREAMDQWARDRGADTDSIMFGGGKLGTEIAGTAGVGGVAGNALGRAAAAVGPRAAASVAPVVEALNTAGFRAGGLTGIPGLAVRSGAGAVTGGAAAGLVNPEDAATGAKVGAALPGAVKFAGWAGNAVGKGVTHGLGMTTGVGAEPVREAFRAGATRNTKFVQNMAGDVPLTDVLDDAKNGLQAMRDAASARYRSGMIPISSDKTVLSFDDLDRAFAEASKVTGYKGQVKNKAAADAVARMREAVDEWRRLDPAEFHTPEGVDALKQKLGAIMESIPFNERSTRLAAGKIYNAAKSTIEKQAPAYAGVMRDYSVAQEQITEIERALSLGDKASKDTAMRKLQSLMRNNVQTNYGNRLDLAHTLEQGGDVDLLSSIAGQAMNSWTPRSLQGQLGTGATVLGSVLTGNPWPLMALPLQSPRLVGNAAYGLGRVTGAASQAPGLLLGQGGTSLLGAPKSDAAGLLGPYLYRAAPVLAADQ